MIVFVSLILAAIALTLIFLIFGVWFRAFNLSKVLFNLHKRSLRRTISSLKELLSKLPYAKRDSSFEKQVVESFIMERSADKLEKIRLAAEFNGDLILLMASYAQKAGLSFPQRQELEEQLSSLYALQEEEVETRSSVELIKTRSQDKVSNVPEWVKEEFAKKIRLLEERISSRKLATALLLQDIFEEKNSAVDRQTNYTIH